MSIMIGLILLGSNFLFLILCVTVSVGIFKICEAINSTNQTLAQLNKHLEQLIQYQQD